MEWWNEQKGTTLDLSNLNEDLRTRFITTRNEFKQKKQERLKEMHDTICKIQERKEKALKALPLRLSLIAQVSHKPAWQELMSKSVLNKKNETEINKLFPPSYQPENILSQLPYVRSLFDYKWEEGMTAAAFEKGRARRDGLETSKKADRSVYGMNQQLQLGAVIETEDPSAKVEGKMAMSKEEIALDRARRKELAKEKKKEKNANKAAAGEKEDFKTLMQRKEQLRLKETGIKEWKQKLQGRATATKDSSEEETSLTKNEKAKDITQQALAWMQEELPPLEVLLVDQNMSKEFFEDKLPAIMDNLDSMESEKQTELINLLRKLNSVKGHVGYGFNV